MLRLLHRTALVIVACLLGLGVILGGAGEAARDPFSPACEKYAYKPPSDTRTLARLKQECARFLAAGIRKGVAANDEWDVRALLDWARGLQACTGADDPLACATKLDTVAAATPGEPSRPPRPAPPRKRAPPEVALVPKIESPSVSRPSRTPEAETQRVIRTAVVAVIVIVVIILLASRAKTKRKDRSAVSSLDEAAERESVQATHPQPPREEPMGENLARQRTAKTVGEIIGVVVAWAFMVLYSGAFVVFVVLGHRPGEKGVFLGIIFFGMLVSLFFGDIIVRRITAILLILFLLFLLSG